MNVSYVKGDLIEAINQFEEPEKLHVAHGANCFHTMNAGVAKALIRRFGIHLFLVDNMTAYGDINKMGTYSQFTSPEGIKVYNCYTQHSTKKGKNGVYVHWRSVYDSLFDIIDTEMYDDDTLFIPKIGTGLAGGKESDFFEVMEDVCYSGRLNGLSMDIVVYSL